jgi:hypothetical protein
MDYSIDMPNAEKWENDLKLVKGVPWILIKALWSSVTISIFELTIQSSYAKPRQQKQFTV